VMNLVVNARDAMPKGGVIHVRTANTELTDSCLAGIEPVPAGKYVEISVADEGCGMDEATLKRIFEPFFTTKEAGKGTGLGLATVYGIMKAARGAIAVETVLGRGSTFRLFFPRAASLDARTDDELTPIPAIAGACVLFVEDEPLVRSAVCRVLRSSGLEVLEAASAHEALALIAAHPEIEGVITDVVMPGPSGPDLVAAVRRRRPDTRALFVSGYTEHPALREMLTTGSETFLQKPFTTDQLLGAVEKMLIP
jgi:two-component system, cell cycle sensor histidine kinase and response regulator CckA